jgi:hypothetical protein
MGWGGGGSEERWEREENVRYIYETTFHFLLKFQLYICTLWKIQNCHSKDSSSLYVVHFCMFAYHFVFKNFWFWHCKFHNFGPVILIFWIELIQISDNMGNFTVHGHKLLTLSHNNRVICKKNIVPRILTHFTFKYNINYFFPIITLINTLSVTIISKNWVFRFIQ